MKFTAISVTTTIAVFAVVIIIPIVLQVFLSKRESSIPGLVLPVLSLLSSLIMVLNLKAPVSPAEVAGSFLLANLPTLVFLAIYFGLREKNRKKKQIDKMNIQDLN